MKDGCESKELRAQRTIELPVLSNSKVQRTEIARSKTRRWRAAALITVTLLMAAHIIQWRLMGRTVSPIEPSETMYTLQNGAINAGFVFFSLAILATLVFGRFVCGWGCHIVALQDFCAWLLRRFGITPKPFRSRLLVFVPLIAALYMFVWPSAVRLFAGAKNEPVIPNFTNHLITTDFWVTFPTVAVAIPFLFICGFLTVYFLGQKGFCTYACPYGGFFGLADKVSPGRIRVTDACNQCGICTATCMANVQVHAEVRDFGMVVDPGCMKHMDCINVCPNDALYFGFGMPAIGWSRNPSAAIGDAEISTRKSQIANRKFSLTWPEETLAAAVFLLSYLAVWDVYQLVPMLMALGIASTTTFLALKTFQLVRAQDVSFYRYALKASGKMQKAGWAFAGFAVLWMGLNAHSGWIRYNERAGAIGFEGVKVPDELALAQPDPREWLSRDDVNNIDEGKHHLYRAFDGGLLVNDTLLPKLAWLEYLSGNTEQAVKLLGVAASHQEGQPKALSTYYRGAILNRLGRYDEALASLDQALAEAPDMILAREEKGESLWQLGHRQEAVQSWGGTLRSNPNLPLSNYLLSGAATSIGRSDKAAEYEKKAEDNTPNDPYFHWMIALRLQNLGMTELAEKHFQFAVQLDPKFQSRRSPEAQKEP